ncbi:hypothetical protein TNCV_2704731 [Trichonephila clavipes]|nr:hypothetical protein TNCV_2704731 [Trichonephila clavipes]
MSTKEREIKPSKHKTKLKSSGRNANKTSDSDENQALAKEKNDLLRQIDFLNSIILDTKLKGPNKSKAQFVKKRKQLHIYKKRRINDNQNNPIRNRTQIKTQGRSTQGSSSYILSTSRRSGQPLMPDDFMIAI